MLFSENSGAPATFAYAYWTMMPWDSEMEMLWGQHMYQEAEENFLPFQVTDNFQPSNWKL